MLFERLSQLEVCMLLPMAAWKSSKEQVGCVVVGGQQLHFDKTVPERPFQLTVVAKKNL